MYLSLMSSPNDLFLLQLENRRKSLNLKLLNDKPMSEKRRHNILARIVLQENRSNCAVYNWLICSNLEDGQSTIN